jgi:MinD superfamily P-loop ATPase
LIIAVAGGKGGVGKTFVSASLARAAAPVQFLDCDVEEPNAHLFLQPSFRRYRPVSIPVPSYRRWKGEVCPAAAEFCRYHALAVVGEEMLVFPELCTGCGLCENRCPVGETAAIRVSSVGETRSQRNRMLQGGAPRRAGS